MVIVQISGEPVQSYNSGDTISLRCTPSGSIRAIQWSRNGTPLPGQTFNTLTVTNVGASEGGVYTCTATNTDGITNSSAVTVHIRPQFTSSSQSFQASNGSIGTLSCAATGFPTPTYQWWRVDRQPIRSALMTTSSMLVFNPVLYGDEGSYYCNATSGPNTVQSQTFTLTSEPILFHMCASCYYIHRCSYAIG